MAKKLSNTGTKASNANAAKAANQHISLTGRACDQMAELSIVIEAYLALERLIATDYQDEALAGVPLSRSGLGALMHILNDAMKRKIDAVADTIAAMLMQLAEGGGEANRRTGSA